MRKIIVILTAFLAVVLTSCSYQPKWVLLHPTTNPPPLAHAGFAYDTNSNEGMVFGGIFEDRWSDETWIWNGNDWRKADAANKPPAREKVAMAYDDARDRMVIFGGSMDKTVFDDTWEWDGEDWILVESAHSPPARCCHAMAFDNVQKKVLLFGGWNSLTGEFFNDTWAWDGKDWTKLPSGDVPLSAAHMLVNFSSENNVVAVPSTQYVNTWKWNGSNWVEVFSLPEPSRADARSAYDSQYNRIIFFGGIENGTSFLSDTWIFDGQAWNLLNLPSLPPARYAHIMFYDIKRNSVVLFGGAGQEGLLGDTWELVLPQDLSSVIIADTTSAP